MNESLALKLTDRGALPLVIFACKTIIILFRGAVGEGETVKGVSELGTGGGVSVILGVTLGKIVGVKETVGEGIFVRVAADSKYLITGGKFNNATMITPINVIDPPTIAPVRAIRATIIDVSSFRTTVS